MRRTGHNDRESGALGTIDLDPLDPALGYPGGECSGLIAIRQFTSSYGVQVVRIQTREQILELIAELKRVYALDQRVRGFRPARGIAGFLGLEELDESM